MIKQRVLVALVLLVFALPLLTEVRALGVQPMIYREYLGQETKDSWVPIFVVYDPPGGGSYSAFSQETSHTTNLKFGYVLPGFQASGLTTQTWTVSESWETSHTERMHYVVCYKYTIKWDVWEYTYPDRVVYRAIRVAVLDTVGSGFYRFDELSGMGIWVNDRTGSQGAYDWEMHVGKGSTGTQVYEYYLSNYGDFGAGFDTTLKGVPFGVAVQIQYTNYVKTQLTYAYHSDTESLDFHIESNYDIGWEGSQPYDVGAISIWFDE